MSLLRETRGTALVTALMLTVLALVIALALLYMVSAGSRITAGQKRYRSALAAAHGGVELVTGDLMPRLLRLDPQDQSSLQAEFLAVGLKLPGYACLQQKLSAPSGAWGACSAAQSSADPATAPDLSLILGGEGGDEGFAVSVKIVDTVPGNTDTSGIDGLDPGNSVSGQQEVIRPQHVPSLYNIAVQGVGGAPREKARLSLLYAY